MMYTEVNMVQYNYELYTGTVYKLVFDTAYSEVFGNIEQWRLIAHLARTVSYAVHKQKIYRQRF